MSSLVEVKIFRYLVITLDPWELMKWIIIKVLDGDHLTATAEYMGKRLTGQLKPYSINRFMPELTMTCLVNLITEKGTFTFNCKHLKEIDVLPFEN